MLFGRVPQNVSAVVVNEPADWEGCQVQSRLFDGVERGVISWQCVRALASASTTGELCQRMNSLAKTDHREFKTPVYRYRVAGSGNFGKIY